MPLAPFSHSEKLSIGVELELQLINLIDFDLIPASTGLLALLKKGLCPGTIDQEITESMIEIGSSIHAGHAGLLAELKRIKRVLLDAAKQLDIGICGGGTHPFQDWTKRKISLNPRYMKLSYLYGYLAKQFTIFGQHIHIGCQSGDDALYLLHALNCYVPHFIALSASSPYVQSKDTWFQSARLNSVSAFPLSGHAPFILSWQEFAECYFEKIALTGIVTSMKDFYWDIRPKPEYGTVELRVCDTPLTMECAAALAAYLQALCAYLLEHRDYLINEDVYLVYNYNRFQACRFGLNGVIVDPVTYAHIAIRDSIFATFDKLEPHANALAGSEGIDFLKALVLRGSDADLLRQEVDKNGRVEDMVRQSLESFREDFIAASTSPQNPSN